MKRLSFSNLSQRPFIYLMRRHNLMKVCLQIPSGDKNNEFDTLDLNTETEGQFRQSSEKQLNQFIDFSESLLESNLDVKKIKKTIESALFLGKMYQQTLDVIFVCLNFQPVSKLSNIAYYLSEKSQNFRRALLKKLQSFVLKKKKQYCELIFLTDMFLYGIGLTQHKFINHVIIESFVIDEEVNEGKPQFQSSHFIHYFTMYLTTLMEPQILLKRYRQKIVNIIDCYLLTEVEAKLILTAGKKDQSLRKLRIQYSLIDQNQSEKQIPNQQVTETQHFYLQNYLQFQQNTHQVLFLWSILIDKLEFFEDQYRQFLRNLYQAGALTGLLSDLSQINQQELLMHIRSSCRNYKNRHLYLPEDVYQLGPESLNFEPIKPTIQNPIPPLDQQFIENLNNCDSIQKSIQLSKRFLIRFNRYQNREMLVCQIFKKMSERNNISFIVRVLAEIGRIQPEVKGFANEQIKKIRNKHSGNSSNSKPFPPKYFKQYSSIIIELCKFQVHSSLCYMEDLLKQIKNQTEAEDETLSIKLSSQVTNYAHNLGIYRAAISIPEVIDILSKMGRFIYYSSLEAHILFNDIIEIIYEGMRNSYVAFEVETISRFNSLVSFLRAVAPSSSNSEKDVGLALEKIKNERKAINLAKKYAKSLKQKFRTPHFQEEIHNITQLIKKSVESHGFISSYYFADFVFKINSKVLDRSIFNMAQQKIVQDLKNENIQGASNWGRFVGELYSYQTIKQKDLIQFLDQSIFQQYLSTQKAGTIKIICSALETCKDLLIKAPSNRQICEILTFLLRVKRELLKTKGLKNEIIQHQISDLMEYFHPALTIFNNYDQIVNFQRSTDFLKVEAALEAMVAKKPKEKPRYMEVGSQKQKTVETSSTSHEKDMNGSAGKAKEEKKSYILSKQDKNSHGLSDQDKKVTKKKIVVISRDRTGAKKINKISCDE